MSVLTRLTAGHKMKDPREGAGGFDALTEADINFAVSTLPAMDAAILLASHIQQEPPPEQMAKILDHLEREMCREWKRQRLGRVDLSKIENMAAMSWHEYSQNKDMTAEEKAEACDMGKTSWKDRYKYVYPAATKELHWIARRSYARVKRALK